MPADRSNGALKLPSSASLPSKPSRPATANDHLPPPPPPPLLVGAGGGKLLPSFKSRPPKPLVRLMEDPEMEGDGKWSRAQMLKKKKKGKGKGEASAQATAAGFSAGNGGMEGQSSGSGNGTREEREGEGRRGAKEENAGKTTPYFQLSDLPISAFGSSSSLSSSARPARSPALAPFPSSAVSPSTTTTSTRALQTVDPAEMARGQRIHRGPSTQQAHSVKRPRSTLSASAPSSARLAPTPNAATPIFSLPLMSYPIASLFPFLASSSTPSTNYSETIHPTLLISPLSSPTHPSDPSIHPFADLLLLRDPAPSHHTTPTVTKQRIELSTFFSLESIVKRLSPSSDPQHDREASAVAGVVAPIQVGELSSALDGDQQCPEASWLEELSVVIETNELIGVVHPLLPQHRSEYELEPVLLLFHRSFASQLGIDAVAPSSVLARDTGPRKDVDDQQLLLALYTRESFWPVQSDDPLNPLRSCPLSSFPHPHPYEPSGLSRGIEVMTLAEFERELREEAGATVDI